MITIENQIEDQTSWTVFGHVLTLIRAECWMFYNLHNAMPREATARTQCREHLRTKYIITIQHQTEGHSVANTSEQNT